MMFLGVVVTDTNIDWRHLFIRYTELVGENEGVDFLDRGDWTRTEWDTIWDAHADLAYGYTEEFIERQRNSPRYHGNQTQEPDDD
jgi:hypothetical protein